MNRRNFIKTVALAGTVIPLKPSWASLDEFHMVMHPVRYHSAYLSYQYTWSANWKGENYYVSYLWNDPNDTEQLKYIRQEAEASLRKAIKEGTGY